MLCKQNTTPTVQDSWRWGSRSNGVLSVKSYHKLLVRGQSSIPMCQFGLLEHLGSHASSLLGSKSGDIDGKEHKEEEDYVCYVVFYVKMFERRR